jgi:hypothetical protein
LVGERNNISQRVVEALLQRIDHAIWIEILLNNGSIDNRKFNSLTRIALLSAKFWTLHSVLPRKSGILPLNTDWTSQLRKP